jgi:hypothetical protein
MPKSWRSANCHLRRARHWPPSPCSLATAVAGCGVPRPLVDLDAGDVRNPGHDESASEVQGIGRSPLLVVWAISTVGAVCAVVAVAFSRARELWWNRDRRRRVRSLLARERAAKAAEHLDAATFGTVNPNTTNAPIPAQLIDDMIECYVDWREACAAMGVTYERWSRGATEERARLFAAYRAALDQEEATEAQYRAVINRVAARAGRPHALPAVSAMDSA